MRVRSRFSFRLAVLTAATCGIFFGVAGSSQAAGVCNSAMIDEEFVLPGGAVHPAGRLTLCLSQDYSPVSSIHEARVDGMPLGALISRHDKLRSLDAATDSLMLFIREPRGTLRLIGYTRAAREHAELYSFVHPSVTTSVGTFLPRSLVGLMSSANGDPQIVRVPAS